MDARYRLTVKFLVLFALPILFQSLGQSGLLLSLCKQMGIPEETASLAKDGFSFFGIVLTFFPLGTSCIRQTFELESRTEQQNYLIRQSKNYLLEAFKGILGETGLEFSLNVRICTPKKNIWNRIGLGRIKINRRRPKCFAMKNLPGLSDEAVRDGLVFQVSPHPQGAVGTCYAERDCVVYEPNLKKSSSENLTEYQREQTQDIAFWICVPVHNKKGDICAIMSYDSNREIHIPPEKLSIVSRLLRRFSIDFIRNMTNLNE
ncbi:hypothetical protein [Caproicibacter fermentans]|uniref:GAF domain-containing protein n=1 Tax=Caproicibacter fermentans TaxID=2576756 RepID=A0A7G8T6X2_9FIRM|nr:hypothetical protein [Caproicibacter fermentans]QNK39363.1 hypothetical protein HCR03_11420 [Caproicibacter fermentans]